MKENQTNHYFNEWWERQARLYASSNETLIDSFDPTRGLIRVYRIKPYAHTVSLPASTSMMEWAVSNPRRDLTRDEFIVALAKRVERLESALAEKGGKR